MSEQVALQQTNGSAAAVAASDSLTTTVFESLALKGDISGLKPEEKVKYMTRLCETLGLNPYTQPFLPLKLGGKEVLYATKGCTDQLSEKRSITRDIINTQMLDGVYIVTCKAIGPDGRYEISTGVVPIGSNTNGEALANALMKAETKAKRRATLSFCGLGFLDESELETIPASRMETIDLDPPKQLADQPNEDPEVTLAQSSIAETCKKLNEAKDSINWSRQALILYAREFFGDDAIDDTDALPIERLKTLSEDLGERLRLLIDNS